MMNSYGVVGNPVSHSLSPKIHRLFAIETGDDLVYDAIFSPVDKFDETVFNFREKGGLGLNITVPFKEQAYFLADAHSNRASAAGVANLIQFSDNQIYADNTDGVGLITDLNDNLGVALQSKRILLLGAGGASRGVLGPLLHAGPRTVTIANRNKIKAEVLAKKNQPGQCVVRGIALTEIEGDEFDIVINATASSLGGEELQIPDGIFSSDSIAYDMMYGPSAQKFLNEAAKKGATKIADGLGMLVEQAAESFFIWRGVRPNAFEVIRHLREG